MPEHSMVPPFPAPDGYRWVFCKWYRHWRSKKLMVAEEYGRKAWCFLARCR